jgi:hypothetical protein
VKEANRVVLLESDSPAVEHQGDIVSARGTSKSNSTNKRSVPFSSHFLSVEQFLKLIMAELPELLKRRAILKSSLTRFTTFFENHKSNIAHAKQISIRNSILSIKNGNDNVRIEDNCLEEELATTPILSEIRTLSLTFVMLMRFFARLNIYYKTFLTRMQCDTTPFTSCCHNVDFCIAFLRQSANNYRHCSFCAQISPVVLKNKQ